MGANSETKGVWSKERKRRNRKEKGKKEKKRRPGVKLENQLRKRKE
jgi:hypothetical protein